MRNLKKFLALVLAMMMAMSLMVTANAAVTSNVTYDDDYHVNEAFEEAVAVLSGMGVIQGYNGGETFMPQQNITRAEAAMLIYRIATGDTESEKDYLYTDYAPNGAFPDVKSDAWYAGAVGYCANFGIAKGRTDGLFHPADPVTGYEILAMILRVVGYDKRGEFTGTDWAYNVSTLSTSLGVTNKVKTANYSKGGTSNLYAPATREVVASLLFETIANVPKVIFSESLSYMNTGMTGGILGSTKNPTVGYEMFGLTNRKGVVVGNEATGEKEHVTKIGLGLNQVTTGSTITGGTLTTNMVPVYKDINGDGEITEDDQVGGEFVVDHWEYSSDQNINVNYSYDYYYNDVVTATGSAFSAYRYANNETFTWDSGLDMFGHAVSVWFDDDYSSRTHNTYAVFDKSTKVEIVGGVTASTINMNEDSGVDNELTDVAKKAGFAVNGATNWNYAFGRSSYGYAPYNANFKSPILENNSDDPHPLYLLISNSANNNLDLVVSLDMTITQIKQENNVKGVSSVGVYNANSSADAVTGLRTGTNDYFDLYDNQTTGTQTYTNIAQSSLVGNSATKLDTKVAAIAITGTAPGFRDNAKNRYSAVYDGYHDYGQGYADAVTRGYGNIDGELNSTYYYQLTELKKVVPATVVNVNYDTQEVFLSDGSSLKRSIFADAVDGTFKANQYVKAPTVFTTYNFTLDSEGKYIYWEPITSTSTFVYGTYLDYQTEFTTSDYLYKMVGVDINGQQTIPEVTGYSIPADPTGIFSLSAGTNYSNNNLPKRDSDWHSGRMLSGRYIGYTLSDGKLKEVTTEAGYKGDGSDVWGGLPEQPMISASAIDFGASSTTITPNDALVGSVKVSNDGSPAKDLFLTNETIFYVVSGAGTGSQKVVTYKGLSELTKDCRSVVIKGSTGVKDTAVLRGDWDGDGTADLTYADMIYYKQHDFGYAQSYVYSAKAADVVYIPADAIDFNKATSSSLYFVGDSDSKVVNATGEVATLFTVYQNGEAVQRWIKGDIRVSGDAKQIKDNGDNVFYDLINTGKKTSNNQDIYSIAPVADISSDLKAADSILIGQFWADNDKDGKGDVVAATTNPGDVIASNVVAIYSATTYSLQSAFIDPNNHYSATELYNVSNAVVNNLDTDTYPGIKDLSTLHQAGSLYDNEGVQVSCVLGEGYRNVTYIYVNANQISLAP